MYFSSYMKTRNGEGVVMILSNTRAVKVTFDKFIEIRIELNNKIFMFEFDLDGGLKIIGDINTIYIDHITYIAKFLTSIEELRLKFIQDKKATIPEIKTYLKSIFNNDDRFTVFEFTEI